jgi:hypothetical protein
VHAHPPSLYLPSPAKLWCTFQLPLFLLYPYMYSVVHSETDRQAERYRTEHEIDREVSNDMTNSLFFTKYFVPPPPESFKFYVELPFLSLFLLLSVYEIEIMPIFADGRVRVEPILSERMENMYLTFFYTAHCPTNLDLAD